MLSDPLTRACRVVAVREKSRHVIDLLNDRERLKEEREKARQEALEHLRPGVSADQLRKFHEQVKSKIMAKSKLHSFSSAFKNIDADRTGSIPREEFKQAMKDFNLAGCEENILETLCDFIDQDGSGAFGYREFAQVLSADDVMQWAPSNVKKHAAD